MYSNNMYVCMYGMYVCTYVCMVCMYVCMVYFNLLLLLCMYVWHVCMACMLNVHDMKLLCPSCVKPMITKSNRAMHFK